MSVSGGDKANEFTLQNDMINRLLANGWLLRTPEKYNRGSHSHAERGNEKWD